MANLLTSRPVRQVCWGLSVGIAAWLTAAGSYAQELVQLARQPFPNGPRGQLSVTSTTQSGDIQGFVLAVQYEATRLRVHDFRIAGEWIEDNPPDFVVPYGTSTHPGAAGVSALMVLIDLSEEPKRVIPARREPQAIATLDVELLERDDADERRPVEVKFVDDEVEVGSGAPLVNHIVIGGMDFFQTSRGDRFLLELESGGFFDEDEPPPVGIFRRGDADGSGFVNITDAVVVFNYLFAGGRLVDCLDAGDTNDDSAVDLSDGIGILLFLFRGGRTPPPPGPNDCGLDPTNDAMTECNYPVDVCL